MFYSNNLRSWTSLEKGSHREGALLPTLSDDTFPYIACNDIRFWRFPSEVTFTSLTGYKKINLREMSRKHKHCLMQGWKQKWTSSFNRYSLKYGWNKEGILLGPPNKTSSCWLWRHPWREPRWYFIHLKCEKAKKRIIKLNQLVATAVVIRFQLVQQVLKSTTGAFII